MTANAKEKRIARQRMADTGENYTTALRKVREEHNAGASGLAACPHCGDKLELVDNGTGKMVLPYHDWPKPARQLCPMSKRSPEETTA